jgi:hypothetical protein
MQKRCCLLFPVSLWVGRSFPLADGGDPKKQMTDDEFSNLSLPFCLSQENLRKEGDGEGAPQFSDKKLGQTKVVWSPGMLLWASFVDSKIAP